MSQQPRKGYKIVSLVTGNLVLDMELLAKLIQYKWRIRIEMFKIGFVYVVRNLSLALRLSVCPVVGKSLTWEICKDLRRLARCIYVLYV